MDLELLNFDCTLQCLTDYAEELQALYKQNLIQSDTLATEKLLNTARYQLNVGGKTFEVSMVLQDYWKNVEYGTKPHWPDKNAILKWIKVKNIIPRPMGLRRAPTENQLAFLISRKISRVGTKGRFDLTNAVQEVNRKYEALIGEALQMDADAMGEKVVSLFGTLRGA